MWLTSLKLDNTHDLLQISNICRVFKVFLYTLSHFAFSILYKVYNTLSVLREEKPNIRQSHELVLEPDPIEVFCF